MLAYTKFSCMHTMNGMGTGGDVRGQDNCQQSLATATKVEIRFDWRSYISMWRCGMLACLLGHLAS